MVAVGSFGHFQASKSGVHKGGWNRPLVKAGFVATRISVSYTALLFSSLGDCLCMRLQTFLHFHVDHVCFNHFRLRISILKLLEP